MPLQTKHWILHGLLARAANTGKSLIGEVVNSRVVLTQLATANYTGTSAKLQVTGYDSNGDSMTELLTFTNGTINDQILGTKVFHSVTSLHITGTPANSAFKVGVYGNSTGTAAGTFDDDALCIYFCNSCWYFDIIR